MTRKNNLGRVVFQKNIIIPSVFLSIYIAFLLTGMYSHEMWRDELQAWSIARESANLSDLYNNLRYEGTPGLWHFMLFILSRFTRNPVAMQVLHSLIAIAATALVLFKTKLPAGIKLLYSLGYFSVYEYGVISRNYAPGVLLIILIAIKMSERVPNFITISLLSILLSFTSVFGILFGICIFCWMVFSTFLTSRGATNMISTLWLPGVMIFLGCALSYISALPPENTAFNELFRTYKDSKLFMETTSSVWASYFPVPLNRIDFWNSNVMPHLYLKFRCSVVLLFSFALCFIKKPRIAFFYILTSCVILLFLYIKFSGVLRHWGHLYLILIVCLIMYSAEHQSKNTPDKILHTLFIIITTFILSAQAFGTFLAMKSDLVYQFTGAKNVAKYVENLHQKHYIIADDQAYVSAVGFYLDEPTYSVKFNTESTFIRWYGETRINRENPEKVIETAKKMQAEKGDTKVLMVTSYFFDNKAPVELLYTSGPSINTKRAINLYELNNE